MFQVTLELVSSEDTTLFQYCQYSVMNDVVSRCVVDFQSVVRLWISMSNRNSMCHVSHSFLLISGGLVKTEYVNESEAFVVNPTGGTFRRRLDTT